MSDEPWWKEALKEKAPDADTWRAVLAHWQECKACAPRAGEELRAATERRAGCTKNARLSQKNLERVTAWLGRLEAAQKARDDERAAARAEQA